MSYSCWNTPKTSLMRGSRCRREASSLARTRGATVRRELFEETGLRLAGPAVHLDSHFSTNEGAPSRIRHYYWLTASPATPDAWSHVVSAGDEDEGMLFLLGSPAPRSRTDARPWLGVCAGPSVDGSGATMNTTPAAWAAHPPRAASDGRPGKGPVKGDHAVTVSPSRGLSASRSRWVPDLRGAPASPVDPSG